MVEIFNPATNDGFEAGDTILVYSRIADDEAIRSIVISLKNDADVPVVSRNVTVSGSRYEDSEKLPVPLNIKAGQYYLDVTAYDAFGSTSAYRYLRIGAVMPAVRSILVFAAGESQTGVYQLRDSVFLYMDDLDGDFLESSVSRSGDIAWTAGSKSGDLNALDSGAGLLWKYESAALPPSPFFREINAGANVLLASLNDGRLLSFLPSGHKESEFAIEANYFAESLFMHGDKIISAEYYKPNGQRRVSIYYYPSGMRRDYTVLNLGSVIGMASVDWDKVLLFCTREGLNTVAELNIENMSLHSQAEQEGNEVLIAFTEAGDRYFISTASDIYEYDGKLKVFRHFISGTMVAAMRYDKPTDELWVAGGNFIRIYNAGSARLLRSYEAPFTISSFELLR